MATSKSPSKAEKAAAKEAARKAAAKAASRKQLFSTFKRFGYIGASILVILALLQYFGGDDSGPLGSTYDDVRTFPVACGATAPPYGEAMEFEGAPDQGLDPTDAVVATIVTSCGTLNVTLDLTTAPIAVNTFIFLARQGYYDGTAAHRLLANREVRFGDPSATGNGNPGFTFDVEDPDDEFEFVRGVLATAPNKTDRNNGQFFIVLAENANLAPAFSPLGSVVDGDDVLDAIAEVPVQSGLTPEVSQPSETLYIESITIVVNP